MSEKKSMESTTPAAPAAGPDERGSALIISMMVMVILTMLGVTFAVLAQQEEKISVNSRDHEQTLYAAEAAVEMAKTWFNDPSSANAFKPADDQMNFALRKGAVYSAWDNDDERAAATSQTDAAVDGSSGNVYTGGNLGGSASRFDKPYRGQYGFTFWGRQATPDVLVCGDSTLDADGLGTADCNATMKQYTDKLNRALSMTTLVRNDGHSSRDFGSIEIEQIRVYRPPVDFTLHTRYGIATIEATAIKKVRSQIVARRTVREVIQEIPFPGPDGAIEAEGQISAKGSAGVHWGAVVSSATSDDIDLPGDNNNFPDAAVARYTSSRFGYHYTINQASFSQMASPVFMDGTNPIIATFLTEALGITKNGESAGGSSAGSSNFQPPTIGDPWLIFRARRRLLLGGTPIGGGPHPYEYVAQDSVIGNANPDFEHTRNHNKSHLFQSQIVRFPPIDYQTWKDVAQSGQPGMYYMKWVSGVSYKRDGRGGAQTFTQWLTQFGTGIFFFDTKDSTKPHDVGTGSSNLTPTHGWSTNMYVEGFIYLNSQTFDSSGSGNGTTKACNMPGEVFLDDGIDLHTGSQTAGNDCICIRYDQEDGCVLGVKPIHFFANNSWIDGDDAKCLSSELTTINASASEKAVAQREADTFRNGIWDSDINNDGFTDANGDITTLGTSWTNFISDNAGSDTSGDGFTGGHGYLKGVLPGYRFGNRKRQGANAVSGHEDWKRDPRFLNHLGESGWSSTVGRQVYEPFLNFDSPTNGNTIAAWAGGTGHAVKVDFRADGEVVERNGSGTTTKSTTRARDATGPLINLDLHINGVFYNEGNYTGNGNMNVYGSLLMRGGYQGSGDVNVWFNEDLVKGRFPPASWNLPRVYSTARDTN